MRFLNAVRSDSTMLRMSSHAWERRAILLFLGALIAVLSFREAPPGEKAIPLAGATALLGRAVVFYFPVRKTPKKP